MIRNILVGYDHSRSSQAALQQALDIAEAAQSWLHLVYVDEAAVREDGLELLSSISVEDHGVAVAATAEEGAFAPEPPPPVEAEIPVLTAGAEACYQAHVPYDTQRLFGTPGERLAHLARLQQLLVVGESSEPRRGMRHHLGPNLRFLLRNCPVPLLVCNYNYRAMDSALVVYQDDAAGGRALSLAGVLCSALNIPLTVAVAGRTVEDPETLVADLELALRVFHVEHEIQVLDRTVAEVVSLVPMEWAARCVVLAYPPLVWPWNVNAIRAAMATPNLMRLIVP